MTKAFLKRRSVWLIAGLCVLVAFVFLLLAPKHLPSRDGNLDLKSTNQQASSLPVAAAESPGSDMSLSLTNSVLNFSASNGPSATALETSSSSNTNTDSERSTHLTQEASSGTNNPEIKGIELVWIVPGSFTMGSAHDEPGRRSNEGPQTSVTLTHGFWLGKYEVTWAQYQVVLGAASSRPRAPREADPDQPVEGISWERATNFCQVLTKQELEAGRLPSGYVYRLPTEAEWEYACRAGTTTRFGFGEGFDASSLGSHLWYGANSYGTTHPVGLKGANFWGLYDMHGNIGEWCLDVLRPAGGSATDPVGTIVGEWHAIRGGAWDHSADDCRSAFRHTLISIDFVMDVGFRVALARDVP